MCDQVPEYSSVEKKDKPKKRLFKTFICYHGIHIIEARNLSDFESKVLRITHGCGKYFIEFFDGHCWIRIENCCEWDQAEKLFDDLAEDDEHGFIKMRVLRRCPWYRRWCWKMLGLNDEEEQSNLVVEYQQNANEESSEW